MVITLEYEYDDWSNTGPSSEFRHQIYLNYERPFRKHNINPYIRWLYDNIGRNEKWLRTSYDSYTVFYFNDIIDAMAFKLRWT